MMSDAWNFSKGVPVEEEPLTPFAGRAGGCMSTSAMVVVSSKKLVHHPYVWTLLREPVEAWRASLVHIMRLLIL